MNSLTIQFSNADDLKQFETFARTAKESEGTVAPLWCGLVSSAMRRATVAQDHAPALLKACRAAIADIEADSNTWPEAQWKASNKPEVWKLLNAAIVEAGVAK
jgi:hypothetical protein